MQYIFENKILTILIGYVVFIISGTIHEYSHARVAYKLGDNTAMSLGRLTLNPLAHMDILGTVILPILAGLTGIPVIGWMKAVPTNPMNYKKNREQGMAIVSFAGPFSNFTLSAIAFILIKIITFPISINYGENIMPLAYYLISLTGSSTTINILAPLLSIIAALLFYFYIINIMLMVFNLLPFPPLDGGWILRYILPISGKIIYDKVYPFGFIILYALMFFGILRLILRPLQSLIMNLLGMSLPILFSF